MADVWTTGAPQPHQDVSDSAKGSNGASAAPAVRFASAVEEIAPGQAPQTPGIELGTTSPPPNVSPDELRQFADSLKGDDKQRPALQQHRMNTFQFEPFSLPASRVRVHPASCDELLHGALPARSQMIERAEKGQLSFMLRFGGPCVSQTSNADP